MTLPRDSDGTLAAFAWPGGYPIVYWTHNCDAVLCAACAEGADDIENADTYMEGPALVCDDCGKILESAYGDPEEDK